MKNKRNIYALLFLWILLLPSCKQQERITRREYKPGNSITEIENHVFYGKTEIKSIKFTKMNFKIDINGEEIESGGNIAIIRDSVIIISVIPMLGYEMTRIFCYKDSVLIIDRVQKTYYSTDFDLYLKKYQINASYRDIESILMNNAFKYEKGDMTEKIAKSIEENDDYLDLCYEYRLGDEVLANQELKFKKDVSGIEKHNILDRQNSFRAEISYDEFKEVEKFYFPFKINFHMATKGSDINMLMIFGNISLNENINAEILIPSRYKKEILIF